MLRGRPSPYQTSCHSNSNSRTSTDQSQCLMVSKIVPANLHLDHLQDVLVLRSVDSASTAVPTKSVGMMVPLMASWRRRCHHGRHHTGTMKSPLKTMTMRWERKSSRMSMRVLNLTRSSRAAPVASQMGVGSIILR